MWKIEAWVRGQKKSNEKWWVNGEYRGSHLEMGEIKDD